MSGFRPPSGGTGLEYDFAGRVDFSTELDDAKKLLEFGIGSETLKRQLFKKLAFKYFCDVSQGVKNQIAQEIDDSFEQRTK